MRVGMTVEERELLRLLALKSIWPFVPDGYRDEFDTELKLDRAIREATVAAFPKATLPAPELAPALEPEVPA